MLMLNYLNSARLVTIWRGEESSDEIDNRVGHIILEGSVRMYAVVGRIDNDSHINQKVFKEGPYVC